MEKSPEEKLRQQKFSRKVWLVLTLLFTAIVSFHLFRWLQGKDNLNGILSPLGMIFLGLATLVEPRIKSLSYVFLAIGMIIVIGGLLRMFL